MDDKNKTFSDLFSSSNEEDSVSSSTSFADIFKNSLASDVNTDVNNDGNISVESIDTVTSASEKNESTDEVVSDFSFFDNDDQVTNKEEKPSSDVSEEKTTEVENTNSVSESSEEVNTDEVVSDFSFFDSNDQVTNEEEKPSSDVSEEKTVEVENTDSNATSSEEVKTDEVVSDFSFFDNNDNEQKTEDVNLNFNLEENLNNDNQVVDNLFFGNDQSAGDEMSVKKDADDKKTKSSNEEKGSESPFFTSDLEQNNVSSGGENPLFLSKLNLIENENHGKKVDDFGLDTSKHFNVKIVKKKEPLIKVIIGVISYAIFIWLLFIGITLLVYVLDIKIRAQRGDYSAPAYNAYVVLTGSMLPEIQVYDVVVTKKTAMSDLKEGDVITFSSADTRFLGTIITHRIIKKNYDAKTKTYSFQTKGDNNNVADSALVPQSNIYGRVILKIPKLGYLQEFLATDGGWIIVILIPCLAVISYDIVKLIKGLKRRKYKNIKVQK